MDTVHEGETGKPWFSTTASRQVSRFVNQPPAGGLVATPKIEPKTKRLAGNGVRKRLYGES